jgi:hypothetical protein
MEVQSADEIVALRSAARTTVTAVMAGMRAIRPGASQRSVEAVVENTCWNSGAHGGSFWPWAMAGENAVFARPFFSIARYDHLNRIMRPGETWNSFVAAYRAGVQALRGGVTVDQVFDVWKKELIGDRAAAKTALAQHAIDSRADRRYVPFWQVHTTNLTAAYPSGALHPGTTINFEPIAAVDGQGFFLDDMYLITKDSTALLTPGCRTGPRKSKPPRSRRATWLVGPEYPAPSSARTSSVDQREPHHLEKP